MSRLPLLCLYFAKSSSSSAGFVAPTSAARTNLLPRLFGRSSPLKNHRPEFGGSASPSRGSSGVQRRSDPRSRQWRTVMSSSGDSAPPPQTSSGDPAGLADIDRGAGEADVSAAADVASWRERIATSIATSIARSRKKRGWNYVQIATVDPETGEPRCRTVVFRGFLPPPPPRKDGDDDDDDDPRPEEESGSVPPLNGESCVMKMITDLRSSKVSEASSHPTGVTEMVWWFAKRSEQYRIRGRLRFVGGGAFDCDGDEFLSRARREQWGNLSDMVREQFYWRDPGVAFTPQAQVPPGGRDEGGKVLPPPDNFLLMLLYPKHVDYLRLSDNFRQVDELDGGAWTQQRVNP